MSRSPSPSQSPQQTQLSLTTTVTAKKQPPIPWTHVETLNLIQAYQDKWYSLKRGQLKASNWDQVASAVASRCGYAGFITKTSTQCRHKIEKLRRRYRVEKQKNVSGFGHGCLNWPYFELMDRLEQGPIGYLSDEEEDEGFGGKSRSINCILRREPLYGDGDYVEKSEEEEEEEEEVRGKGDRWVSALAREIRGFAERFSGMESLGLKMMRESKRRRVEMENKRMEMVFHYEREVIGMIDKVFGSTKNKRLRTEDEES